MADVREMIIQHVLTEDIFMRVFDEAEFHRENVIAHKLAEVAGTFYTGRDEAQHPCQDRAVLRDDQRAGFADQRPSREAEIFEGVVREFLQGV